MSDNAPIDVIECLRVALIDALERGHMPLELNRRLNHAASLYFDDVAAQGDYEAFTIEAASALAAFERWKKTGEW